MWIVWSCIFKRFWFCFFLLLLFRVVLNVELIVGIPRRVSSQEVSVCSFVCLFVSQLFFCDANYSLRVVQSANIQLYTFVCRTSLSVRLYVSLFICPSVNCSTRLFSFFLFSVFISFLLLLFLSCFA